jgi:predicted metalloprotease with PDZ domain
MKDVVSTNFSYVTPLSIHSKEIQYFDYNMQKMSNLWMYEGVTEYFANLFQINQGLITEDEFYTRISEGLKEQNNERQYVFHYHERNVLTQPYKDQYVNVYQKAR